MSFHLLGEGGRGHVCSFRVKLPGFKFTVIFTTSNVTKCSRVRRVCLVWVAPHDKWIGSSRRAGSSVEMVILSTALLVLWICSVAAAFTGPLPTMHMRRSFPTFAELTVRAVFRRQRKGSFKFAFSTTFDSKPVFYKLIELS